MWFNSAMERFTLIIVDHGANRVVFQPFTSSPKTSFDEAKEMARKHFGDDDPNWHLMSGEVPTETRPEVTCEEVN